MSWTHLARRCGGQVLGAKHLQRSYSATKHYPTKQRGLPLGLVLASGTCILGYFGWRWQQSFSNSQQSLSYSYFTPLTIRAIKQITSDSSVISLELPHELLPDNFAYPEPPHTPLQALYIRQPELQIQRAYTPLNLDCFQAPDGDDRSPNDGSNRSINFLVKRYKDGEVSSYVHRQGPGDQLWVRGPVRTWTLPEADELIFIAGGTGLTPLIQMLNQRHSLPKTIKLVYSASSPEKSLLPLLPPTEGVSIHPIYRRLTYRNLESLVGKPKAGQKTQIIVCGPEEFICDIAGKRSLNAQHDPVGGVLAQLGWQQDRVKKL